MVAWRGVYATVDEFSEFLRDERPDDTSSAKVRGRILGTASREIDTFTSRQFGVDNEATTRFYPMFDGVVSIDDTFAPPATVSVEGEAVAVTPHPLNAKVNGRPFTTLKADTSSPSMVTATVTAIFGWPEVPDTIVQATLQQALRLLKRREAPFGIAGSPDFGSEMRLLDKIDADVEVMLRSYRRWWVAG